MNFIVEDNDTPIITVIGVGGAGSNAVSNMYKKNITNVNFIVCNTDLKALNNSPVPTKIQLGVKFSDGDGAGNNADNGKAAAIESLDDIMEHISENTKMVFLTAGMGGGTGTGATPVLAKALKKRGILTVGIVTIPFHFEGSRRINQAAKGIINLNRHIDSLIIVDNQKIFRLYPDLVFSQAYSKADEVVTNAAKGVAELINLAGYVNVDFEDVRTVLANSGVALMGISTAFGEERAMNSIKQAIKSPLLENNNIKGAKNILLNIVSGQGVNEITMDEVSEITDYVISQVGDDAQVLWGVGYDDSLEDRIATTIIATDFDSKDIETILALPNIDFKLIREQIKIEAAADLELKNSIEKQAIAEEVLVDDISSDSIIDEELSITINSENIELEQQIEDLISEELVEEEKELILVEETPIRINDQAAQNDVVEKNQVEDLIIEDSELLSFEEDVLDFDFADDKIEIIEDSVIETISDNLTEQEDEIGEIDLEIEEPVEIDVIKEENSVYVDNLAEITINDSFQKSLEPLNKSEDELVGSIVSKIFNIASESAKAAVVVEVPKVEIKQEVISPEEIDPTFYIKDKVEYISPIDSDDCKIMGISMMNATMQPNMSDKKIKEIESIPAYQRHKKILE